ncbi:MAG: GNAT family N-acetyltransferase [Rhodospirillales bacterium]|nr:GNAT family N-acetyltransferase [Rhodospirillales bacterium]
MSPSLTLVTLADHPDLLPTLQAWLGNRRTPAFSPAHCFILLAARARVAHGAYGVPAGTASLTPRGLDSRADLTPWLANLYVPPAYRGRGHAQRLVAAVESAARAARVPTLWLVTRSAAPLYARLGWQPVGPTLFHGDPATLMRRDLAPIAPPLLAQSAKPYRVSSAAT